MSKQTKIKEELIILVDENDNETGFEEKLKTHQRAKRHRAFSVFVFREKKGELQLLLQRRRLEKYHCGGLWTNTCCSHPRKGEKTPDAAQRRLAEEMGFSVELKRVGVFEYKAEFDNGLTEYEIDHVFAGQYGGEEIKANTEEVLSFRWISVENLREELRKHSNKFTPWFEPALNLVLYNNKLVREPNRRA